MQGEPAKEKENQISVHLEEYKTLKVEQLKRIAVRDHVIYLTIAAVGLLVSAIDKLPNGVVLLVIPWVSVLLGWTYLMNDQKVSAIGQYIRHDLDNRMKSLLSASEDLFGWETGHRSDEQRQLRKYTQLIIDLLAFVLPGMIASGAFLTFYDTNVGLRLLAAVEILLLFVLAWQIVVYADLARGK
jgi:hypothetical protein